MHALVCAGRFNGLSANNLSGPECPDLQGDDLCRRVSFKFNVFQINHSRTKMSEKCANSAVSLNCQGN
jgi:hypothetical protein